MQEKALGPAFVKEIPVYCRSELRTIHSDRW